MDTDLHPGRHFFLYAKHFYRRGGNVLEDVRRITADYIGCDPQCVSDDDVLTAICNIALPCLLDDGNSIQYEAWQIFYNLIEVSRVEDRPLTVKDVVLQMLSVLAAAQLKDAHGNVLIKLGEPNYCTSSVGQFMFQGRSTSIRSFEGVKNLAPRVVRE